MKRRLSPRELEAVSGGRMSERQWNQFQQSGFGAFRQDYIRRGVYDPQRDGPNWLSYVARLEGMSIKDAKVLRERWVQKNYRPPGSG